MRYAEMKLLGKYPFEAIPVITQRGTVIMELRLIHRLVAGFCAALVATAVLTACGESAKPTPAQTPPVAFTVVANSAPHFEAQAGWGAGYAKATGKGPGVVVGPGPEAPNTFAQGFVAKPNEPFKIVAKASSVDKPQAQGRLQINWHGADAKYIGTSSQVIDVTQTEKTFEYQTVSPPEAMSGILYVVSHGAEDTVRYTEMTLLKAN